MAKRERESDGETSLVGSASSRLRFKPSSVRFARVSCVPTRSRARTRQECGRNRERANRVVHRRHRRRYKLGAIARIVVPRALSPVMRAKLFRPNLLNSNRWTGHRGRKKGMPRNAVFPNATARDRRIAVADTSPARLSSVFFFFFFFFGVLRTLRSGEEAAIRIAALWSVKRREDVRSRTRKTVRDCLPFPLRLLQRSPEWLKRLLRRHSALRDPCRALM